MSDSRSNYDVAETKFAQALQRRMDEMDLSLKDLADRTGSAYETIRKLLRGIAFPSKYMTRVIALELGLDPQSMLDLVNMDKLCHKFGNAPAIVANKNPELEPIEMLWSYLTDNQKQQVIESVRTFARLNRIRDMEPKTPLQPVF